jgi:hypothetical protein
MATIDATVGGATSNSYLTVAEADAYFDTRIALVPPWSAAADPDAALIMATRVLDALAQPFKTFVPGPPGDPGYYRVRRQWTGAAATSTQRLAWPRTGMLTRNGYPIASTVIPQELKDATAELAGQLLAQDFTLNNAVAQQGIASVKAGSVAVSFRDDFIFKQVIPDAVYDLLVQSWLTDEVIESVGRFEFEVI